jgi:hypothetical protein
MDGVRVSSGVKVMVGDSVGLGEGVFVGEGLIVMVAVSKEVGILMADLMKKSKRLGMIEF